MDKRLERLETLGKEIKELEEHLRKLKVECRKLNTVTFTYTQLRYVLTHTMKLEEKDIDFIMETSQEFCKI